MGVFIGVVLAPLLGWEFLTEISWLLTAIALGLIAIMKQRAYLLICALLAGLLIGLWRGSLEIIQLHSYDNLYETVVVIKGRVSEGMDRDKRGNSVLRLDNVSMRSNNLGGKLWVTLEKNPEINRSDMVTISGKLDKGFGTFAGSIYQADIVKIERPTPGDIALHVRDWFATALRSAIPNPEAALGIGYLVGQRRDLPQELDAA